MTGTSTTVIGAAGRRRCFVDWLREAFEALGRDGRAVVTENDPTSSSATYGDVAWRMPRYADSANPTELLTLVEDLRPRLFVSVNDYELMHLHVHSDLAEQLRRRGVLVPGVTATWQVGCVDKLRTASLLEDVGAPIPATVTVDDAQGIAALAAQSAELVIKHRFGSGYRGLAVVPGNAAVAAVATAVRTAPATGGRAASEDDVVVQSKLLGAGHGVDIAGDLHDAGALRAVLTRRKLRMCEGETDKAVPVDPEPFRRNAEPIARSAGLTGLVDVDMFLDEGGKASVFDINPQFGGGHHLVHLAGAEVARCCVTQAFDPKSEDGWRSYASGVISAKFESVRATGRVA